MGWNFGNSKIRMWDVPGRMDNTPNRTDGPQPYTFEPARQPRDREQVKRRDNIGAQRDIELCCGEKLVAARTGVLLSDTGLHHFIHNCNLS